MNIIQCTCVLLMSFSLVFVGEVEAKHASQKTRSRILKESSKGTTKVQYSTVNKVKA